MKVEPVDTLELKGAQFTAFHLVAVVLAHSVAAGAVACIGLEAWTWEKLRASPSVLGFAVIGAVVGWIRFRSVPRVRPVIVGPHEIRGPRGWWSPAKEEISIEAITSLVVLRLGVRRQLIVGAGRRPAMKVETRLVGGESALLELRDVLRARILATVGESRLRQIELRDAHWDRIVGHASRVGLLFGAGMVVAMAAGFWAPWFSSPFDIRARAGIAGWLLPDGGLYRTFAAGMLHDNGIHLWLNLLAIYSLSKLLEPTLGVSRVLVIGLGGLVAGSAAIAIAGSAGPALGGSGVFAGLLGAGICICVHRGEELPAVFPVQTGRLVILAVYWVLFELLIPISATAAHVGGFLAGVVLGAVMVPRGTPLERPRISAVPTAIAVVLGAATLGSTAVSLGVIGPDPIAQLDRRVAAVLAESENDRELARLVVLLLLVRELTDPVPYEHADRRLSAMTEKPLELRDAHVAVLSRLGRFDRAIDEELAIAREVDRPFDSTLLTVLYSLQAKALGTTEGVQPDPSRTLIEHMGEWGGEPRELHAVVALGSRPVGLLQARVSSLDEALAVSTESSDDIPDDAHITIRRLVEPTRATDARNVVYAAFTWEDIRHTRERLAPLPSLTEGS